MRFPIDIPRVYALSEDRAYDSSREIAIPTGRHPGSFGFVRKHHVHEGVDLYVPEGTPIYACERGIFRGFHQFTGPEVGSPWWQTTFSAVVELEDGSACLYGEIAPAAFNLPDGYPIGEGNLLGWAIPVLTKDKGRPGTMLHFERYVSPTPNAAEWKPGEAQPENLLDPTEYLIRAAKGQGIWMDELPVT